MTSLLRQPRRVSRRVDPDPPAPLVDVPTRTDLSTAEQEWYLLHAARSPREHAQRLRWAVAMCWSTYVQARVGSNLHGHRPCNMPDLHQAGLMGVYHAAERYRLNGTWTSCVYWGVRSALQQESRRHQLGAWVSDRNLRLLCRAERLQAQKPGMSVEVIARKLDADPGELRSLLAAAAVPLDLQTWHHPDGELGIVLTAEDQTEHRLQVADLEQAVDQLPEPYRGLLIDRWGLRGRRAMSVRRLADRYRLQRRTVASVLEHLQAHLAEVMSAPASACGEYSPPISHTLERLVYEAHTQTFLTWAEVAADYDLDTRREAMLLAGAHAYRSSLPKPLDDDRHRVSTQIRVRNEDCYQLASEARAWSEVARLAGVDSAAVAARHARTFAHRLRPDSNAG